MSDDDEKAPLENSPDSASRAVEKSNEFRMHAELAAVFEGPRKTDAQVKPTLDAETARDVQRAVGRLDKAKVPNTPVITPEAAASAADVLAMPVTHEALTTNDYHVHRRPGETMIIRWLAGDEVDYYYTRVQAHFDAALAGFLDEQRANEWKQDDKTLAFIAEMEKLDVKLAERYLRGPIREHDLFVLSTVTADELNIAYLTDHIMQVPATELVAAASAPPDEPSEQDLAWFFKLFLLRGIVDGVERMCFFTFLQKTDDNAW